MRVNPIPMVTEESITVVRDQRGQAGDHDGCSWNGGGQKVSVLEGSMRSLQGPTVFI